MPSGYIHFNISKAVLLGPQVEGLCGGPAVRRGFACAFTIYYFNYKLTPPPDQQKLSILLHKVLHTTASVFAAVAFFFAPARVLSCAGCFCCGGGF